MSETTSTERCEIANRIQHGSSDWPIKVGTARLARLLADVNRLAQYESQCIPRTADMPNDAVIFRKYGDGSAAYQDMNGLSAGKAPDLLPDTPGPVYRHIVDLE